MITTSQATDLLTAALAVIDRGDIPTDAYLGFQVDAGEFEDLFAEYGYFYEVDGGQLYVQYDIGEAPEWGTAGPVDLTPAQLDTLERIARESYGLDRIPR